MTITLTEEHFSELLELVHIGSVVRKSVLDDTFDESSLEDLLCMSAFKQGLSVVEECEHEMLCLSDDVEERCHHAIEAFIEHHFWAELVMRLGQRDSEKHMTLDDVLEMLDEEDALPSHVHVTFEKYMEEFGKFGIERLEINRQAAVRAYPECMRL